MLSNSSEHGDAKKSEATDRRVLVGDRNSLRLQKPRKCERSPWLQSTNLSI